MGKSDALEISFGVSEPTAEQVFVRLQHQDKPIVKTFPTSGPSSGVFVYKLVRAFLVIFVRRQVVGVAIPHSVCQVMTRRGCIWPPRSEHFQLFLE
jgi:hypothetical protein